MHRRRLLALLLLAGLAAAGLPLLSVVPQAAAGTAGDPEVEDPAGDHAVAGELVVAGVSDDGFEDIDILAAWVAEPRNDVAGAPRMVSLHLESAGDQQAAATVTFAMVVARTPLSVPTSTATEAGIPANVTVAGDAVEGSPDATVSRTAATLTVTLPAADLGASPGDELRALTVTTHRLDPGNVPAPGTQDDRTGTDEAGPGATFALAVQPTPALALRVLGGDLGGVPFSGATSPAWNGERSANLTVEVRNAGNVPVAYGLAVTVPAGLDGPQDTAAGQPLPPAQARQERVALRFLDGPPQGGDYKLTIRAVATVPELAGGPASVVATLLGPPVGAPPPVAPREVVPAGLDFLSPAAEAVRLDKAFGAHAEMFLLAVLVLAAILAVFLAMTLGPAVRVPRAASAPVADPRLGRAGEAKAGGRVLWRKGDGGSVELELEGPWSGEGPVEVLGVPDDEGRADLAAAGARRAEADWRRHGRDFDVSARDGRAALAGASEGDDGAAPQGPAGQPDRPGGLRRLFRRGAGGGPSDVGQGGEPASASALSSSAGHASSSTAAPGTPGPAAGSARGAASAGLADVVRELERRTASRGRGAAAAGAGAPPVGGAAATSAPAAASTTMAPRVRIESVLHEPARPAPGQQVRTAATVRNDGAQPAALRVVLSVDGNAKAEERVELAARESRTVALPWTASDGQNRVRVQVFGA